VQVAAAEGSTKKADMRLGAGLLGGGFGAAAGGYGNTNEGKIIAAALMDNYNNIVGAIKGDPNLQRNVGSLAQEAAAGGAKATNGTFAQGDVLGPKIAGCQADGHARRRGQGGWHAGARRRGGRDRRGKERLRERAGLDGGGWVKIVLVSKK
jgi:hypothetical protein